MRFVMQRKKRPGEKFRIGVNFAKDVATEVADASTDTYSVTATDMAGADISGTILGVKSRNVDTVMIPIVNNVLADKDFLVIFKMTTSQGWLYEHEVLVNQEVHG